VEGGGWVEVWRYRAMHEAQRGAVVSKLQTYAGRRYGWWKVGVHALDKLCGGRYVFRRLLGWDRYPICSWVVACAFEVVRPKFFGIVSDAAQPDDIYDACVSRPSEFERISTWSGT